MICVCSYREPRLYIELTTVSRAKKTQTVGVKILKFAVKSAISTQSF